MVTGEGDPALHSGQDEDGMGGSLARPIGPTAGLRGPLRGRHGRPGVWLSRWMMKWRCWCRQGVGVGLERGKSSGLLPRNQRGLDGRACAEDEESGGSDTRTERDWNACAGRQHQGLSLRGPRPVPRLPADPSTDRLCSAARPGPGGVQVRRRGGRGGGTPALVASPRGRAAAAPQHPRPASAPPLLPVRMVRSGPPGPAAVDAARTHAQKANDAGRLRGPQRPALPQGPLSGETAP